MSELPAEGRSTMRLFYHKVRALSSIDSFPFCNPSFRSATVKNNITEAPGPTAVIVL